MPFNLLRTLVAVGCCLSDVEVASSQNTTDGLFDSDTVLQVKLSGPIRKLFNDRGDESKYHPLALSYYSVDNREVAVNLKAKTRGNFRRNKSNCIYPPILLNFQKKESVNTIFRDQDKVKLVVPCRSDKYVIHEYLVYKLYNLITPKSFKARLVKINLSDTETGSNLFFYGMLLEEDGQMAKRNSLNILNKKMIRGEQTESETFIKMAVFQYMIGNTDWSVPYLHNIRIVAFDSTTIPYTVPYDFDHAGIVDASYALPPEELELRSTRHRRFRGYCISDMKTFGQVIAAFNRLKNDIYRIYTDCPLLEAKYISSTTKFLDNFYATINNPNKLKAEFSYPCNLGNPNIVIKGLGKEKKDDE
jgi:hypothetical protein